MSKKYKVCLIGCGRMGATIDDEVRDRPDSFLWLPYSHAAGYVAVEEVDFVAVSDAVLQKVESIQKRYNVPRGYVDYKKMIQEEQPDIVSIATRPATHAEMTVFAAQNGVKGIYCEKPLCCSMEEADVIVKACEKHNVKFNYGTQRRYIPLYQKMRELIDSGELGKIECVIGHCGVGAALWGHSHTSDMLMYLAGDPEVEFVQGTISAQETDWEGNRLKVDPGVPLGYVKFKNGVHGYQIAASGYEFEVSGNKGKIRSLNNGGSHQLRKVQGKWNLIEEVPFPEVKRGSGTVNCIKDIINAIETNSPTKGSVQLARRSQEMIMGFIESSRLGGSRVAMPLENRGLYVGPTNW